MGTLVLLYDIALVGRKEILALFGSHGLID
jgi:hypothetical protein